MHSKASEHVSQALNHSANQARPAETGIPLDLIQAEMLEVATILEREMSSRYPKVNEIVSYGCMLGGKRLRPALLLLTARALGHVNSHHHTLAAVLEMIHTATLVHDDILDDADERRHLQTVHSRWSTEASVLLGDFLFTHAFYLASTLPTTYAALTIGKATNAVCEGELRQISSKGEFELSEEDYLSIIEAKTAELCACACQLGAHYADVEPAVVQQAEQFGRALGIAFQIVDDLLDLEGTEEKIGKTLGTDLDQQKPTLPLIHALGTATPAVRQELLTILHGPAVERKRMLVPMLRELDSFTYTRDRAVHFVKTAQRSIESWPTSEAKTALSQLAQFVLRRCY